MNKIKALVATAILGCGLSAPASAGQMFMDVSQFGVFDFNGDGKGTTGLFSEFVTTPFTPKSIYLDIDNSPGINTGDAVIDSVQGLSITALSPLAGLATEGYNSFWNLSINWTLQGIAAIVQDAVTGVDNYVGLFNAGEVTVDLNVFGINGLQTASTTQNILTLDLIGFSGSTPQNSRSTVNFSLRVRDVFSGVFFNAGGVDFATIISNGGVVDLLAETRLDNLDNVPVLTQTVDGVGQYERTTFLNSVDIRNVPAPASIAIFGLALMGLGATRRMKK